MTTVKSADRVIQILETVGSKDDGMPHGELSRILGIPKGSLSLLLSNLVDRDYLTYDRSSKLYMFGPKLLVLAGRYLSNLDIVRVGRPVLRELVAEINEDIELAIMKGIEILFVYKEECSHPLKFSVEIGDRAPMYATAAGKAILAHLSEDEVARYLSAVTLASMTKNTVTEPALLMRELKNVRAKGVAYSREEYQQGVSAIAAPVFNFYGDVAGSATVTMPTIRFITEQKRFIEPRLLKAAAKISRQLGFEPCNGGNGRVKQKAKIGSPS
jgi:IclR family transcriptional regulator, KDG regulon repressor